MGNLYVVSTPIGNLEDITVRAARLLLNSDVIIAESASKAGILLRYLEEHFPQFEKTEPKIISLSEDEELNKIPQVVKILEESDATLISEAGTPIISDPGFLLVREAVRRDIKVIPIPGANAITAALSVSGLPSDRFLFLGFLPRQDGKKNTLLKQLKASIDSNRKLTSSIVIYESPHRILATIEAIYSIFGNVDIVVAREMTKMHEQIIRGRAGDIASGVNHFNNKGEMTLVFTPYLT